MNYPYHIQSLAPSFDRKYITLCGSCPANTPLPYTLHTEIELRDNPINDMHRIIVYGWKIKHIDPLDLSKSYNDNLLDLLHSGCDLTGRWIDSTNIGSTSIITSELRRTNPDANIRFIFRCHNKKTARLYITLWDTNPDKVTSIVNEVLEIFYPFARTLKRACFQYPSAKPSAQAPSRFP